MKIIKIFSVTLLMTFLIGCTSTGGTIGGLIPAPKFTKGIFENSEYTAKDKSFRVSSPFKSASYAEKYIEISESYDESENHIVFSSSVAPAEVYRIDIFKDVQNTELFKEFLLDHYKNIFKENYGTDLKKVNSDTLKSNGLEFYTVTFHQKIPERKSGLSKIQGFDSIHSAYFTKKGDRVAFIWINRMPPGKEIMTPGAEARVKEFIQTFELI